MYDSRHSHPQETTRARDDGRGALEPSPSQRAAIEADPQPLLVLAGPGSGKTFCLIERIRFLVEKHNYDPARICAFTFTNRAAEEISTRLSHQLGERADQIKRGTIHAFCAELLREFGAHVGLAPGFGIVDEDYQIGVLRRLRVPEKWRRNLPKRFTGLRFCRETLHPNDARVFAAYQSFLAKRNLVDFDQLVLKTAELLQTRPEIAQQIRDRWGSILVDEFQDLNTVQYGIVRDLGQIHGHVFAVGDDEQSIYSWAGATPRVFRDFMNDFARAKKPVHLQDNRRCPREVFALARRLVTQNAPLFEDREYADPTRDSAYPVSALSFETEKEEADWVLDDLRRDRAEHALSWGDIALLYRRHEIGVALEAGFLARGIPVRLAQGRALAEDPVVEYVIAALQVIAHPGDSIRREQFLAVVLPRILMQAARAKAQESRKSPLVQLRQIAAELPAAHEDAKKIKRGFHALNNLRALRQRHTNATQLVEEILSQRVGVYQTILEEHHDAISDPASHPEVVTLANRLTAARALGNPVGLPRIDGVEIGLAGILGAIGVTASIDGDPDPLRKRPSYTISPNDLRPTGIALGVFKAAQLVASRGLVNAFRDFTTIDIETTDSDLATAEIVEIAATRVRDGKIVDQYSSLVKPTKPVETAAREKHQITDEELAAAPTFAEVWPAFREFCGSDILVAHNGYAFDFPIICRLARALTGRAPDFYTYDTLLLARAVRSGSAKLEDLARAFNVDPGQAHRALADTNTTALVFLALSEAKLARDRKVSLVNVLDHLGVALSLSDPHTLPEEASYFRREIVVPYALGRHSKALEFYRAERDRLSDVSLPTLDQVIEKLGGQALMERLRTQRSADDRYPDAMLRLRTILAHCDGPNIDAQIEKFLERAVLSKWDGIDPERVNLLTLHSTKGLEFSRVYVIGAEDAQMPGGGGAKGPSKEEIEESRRLLYVGMTRAKDRLVLTHCTTRGGKPGGGHQFLDEMGLELTKPNDVR